MDGGIVVANRLSQVEQLYERLLIERDRVLDERDRVLDERERVLAERERVFAELERRRQVEVAAACAAAELRTLRDLEAKREAEERAALEGQEAREQAAKREAEEKREARFATGAMAAYGLFVAAETVCSSLKTPIADHISPLSQMMVDALGKHVEYPEVVRLIADVWARVGLEFVPSELKRDPTDQQERSWSWGSCERDGAAQREQPDGWSWATEGASRAEESADVGNTRVRDFVWDDASEFAEDVRTLERTSKPRRRRRAEWKKKVG